LNAFKKKKAEMEETLENLKENLEKEKKER
jgi:hypothetical protein